MANRNRVMQTLQDAQKRLRTITDPWLIFG
jgi:hypothetical protein